MVKSKNTLEKIKLAQWGQAHMLYLPLYVALYSGLARSARLEFDLKFVGNDDAVFQQVAKEKCDFGVGDPLFVAIGKKQNMIAHCIGIMVHRAALWGVTHNPTIPILRQIQDFVQLRIGSFPKPSTTHALITRLKDKHKRLLKYMQIIEAPIGEQGTLLTENKADVILELEPMVSLAEEQGLRVVFSLAAHYPKMALTGLMASDTIMQTRPDLIKKMISLLDKSLQICNHDTKTSLRVAQKMFPEYSLSILETSLERLRQSDVWPVTSEINRTDWQVAYRLRRSLGDV